ncbi:hypothetical protein [Amycolatopsis sp. NPDC051102]|uniref:hypothetical protein n=1 Tax=Amycolatopsis sp. NPDC051102 TaxID=3155163 RepID=UPI00344217C6
MESPLDDLHDEYPVGWVLTYRRRGTAAGRPFGACAVGMVLGPPVRDACTGLESIPLASPGDGRTVWVPDRDVIGIDPRRPPGGGTAPALR